MPFFFYTPKVTSCFFVLPLKFHVYLKTKLGGWSFFFFFLFYSSGESSLIVCLFCFCSYRESNFCSQKPSAPTLSNLSNGASLLYLWLLLSVCMMTMQRSGNSSHQTGQPWFLEEPQGTTRQPMKFNWKIQGQPDLTVNQWFLEERSTNDTKQSWQGLAGWVTHFWKKGDFCFFVLFQIHYECLR